MQCTCSVDTRDSCPPRNIVESGKYAWQSGPSRHLDCGAERALTCALWEAVLGLVASPLPRSEHRRACGDITERADRPGADATGTYELVAKGVEDASRPLVR